MARSVGYQERKGIGQGAERRVQNKYKQLGYMRVRLTGLRGN